MHGGDGHDSEFYGDNGNDALHPGKKGPYESTSYDGAFYGARLPPSARPRRVPAAAPSYAARSAIAPQPTDADARRASRAQAAMATTPSTAI